MVGEAVAVHVAESDLGAAHAGREVHARVENELYDRDNRRDGRRDGDPDGEERAPTQRDVLVHRHLILPARPGDRRGKAGAGVQPHHEGGASDDLVGQAVAVDIGVSLIALRHADVETQAPGNAVRIFVEAKADAAAPIQALAVVNDTPAPRLGEDVAKRIVREAIAQIERDRAILKHLIGQAVAINVNEVVLGLGGAGADVGAERRHIRALGTGRRGLGAVCGHMAAGGGDRPGDIAGAVGAEAEGVVCAHARRTRARAAPDALEAPDRARELHAAIAADDVGEAIAVQVLELNLALAAAGARADAELPVLAPTPSEPAVLSEREMRAGAEAPRWRDAGEVVVPCSVALSQQRAADDLTCAAPAFRRSGCSARW